VVGRGPPYGGRTVKAEVGSEKVKHSLSLRDGGGCLTAGPITN